MENTSKLLMLGFSIIMFAAAIMVTMIMYYENQSFMDEIEGNNSYRKVIVGD